MLPTTIEHSMSHKSASRSQMHSDGISCTTFIVCQAVSYVAQVSALQLQACNCLQVKLKNPSLLLQLQSVPPRMPGLTASILSASGANYSAQKTLLTTLTRSPGSGSATMQESGRLNRSPSNKGAWAY